MGDAMQLSKLDTADNEDLKINCGRTRRQWLSSRQSLNFNNFYANTIFFNTNQLKR